MGLIKSLNLKLRKEKNVSLVVKNINMSTTVKFAHLRIDEQNDFVDGTLAVTDSLAAIVAASRSR